MRRPVTGCLYKKIRDIFILSILLTMTLHDHALAEISANYSPGAIRIGPATDTCNAGIEGAIRYNSAGKVFEYCNATAWTQITNSTCTLASMLDVQITTPLDGQPLAYDTASGKWKNNACDTSPNSVNFTDLTQQTVSTLVTSNIIQIAGIGCSVNASISGQGSPEYRICSNSDCSTVTTNWTTAVNPVSSGSYIQARLTTSASLDTPFTATMTVGTVSDNWIVRTIGPKRVFVTSQTYKGDLGGLIGADSKCQSLADAANMGSTFKAWLSDNTTSASSRMTQSTLNYVRTDGVVVANGWTDLTDGSIDNIINRDENGTARSGDVWTNTTSSGARKSATDTCSNWTSSSTFPDIGYGGTVSWPDYSWTDIYSNQCSTSSRLYCFEQ